MGKTIYMEIINKHYNNMKRDQSISLTYLPPRVRVVEVFSDQRILALSKEATFEVYVDESESIDPATEKSWIQF